MTDLSLPGPVFDWKLQRTYDSGLHTPNVGEVGTAFGDRWLGDAEGPYLVAHSDDVHLIPSASSQRAFTEDAGDYTAPPDYSATLVKTSETDTDDRDGDSNSTETIDVFRLTEVDNGNVFVFLGFDGDVDEDYRGKLVERTTRPYIEGNQTGIVYAYNDDGYVSQVTPANAGYTIDYTYHTTGTLDGRLQNVEVKKSSTVIAKAEYWYKASASQGSEFPSSPHTELGDDTDLVQVKVSLADSAGALTISRYTQYRYYTSDTQEDVDGDMVDDGDVHQLKFVFDSDAVQRILESGISSLDTPAEILAAADSAVDDFASRRFTYYTSGVDTTSVDTPWASDENLESKYGVDQFDFEETNPLSDLIPIGVIKTEKINGQCATCGSSASGGVTKHYFHLWLYRYDIADFDQVSEIIVEDTVDSSGTPQYRRVYGLNTSGVAIREALLTDPLDSEAADEIWCWSKLVNEDLRITEERMPSAHKGEVISDADLIKFFNYELLNTTNDADTVSSSEGVVYYHTYNADKYPTEIRVRKGRDTDSDESDRYLVSATDWTNQGAEGATNFLPSATYTFPTKQTSKANGVQTQYAYTFWSGQTENNTAIATVTTTLPSIVSGQNGSGTSTTTVRHFDTLGRLRWTKDGEGYVNYYSYHPEFGNQAYMMVDVNDPNSPGSDITGGDNSGPSGTDVKWLPWTGHGANSNRPSRGGGLPTGLGLVTKQEYDDQGRHAKTIDTGGDEHVTRYISNGTIEFPHVDGSGNPALPAQVTMLNGGGVLLESYSVDPSTVNTSTTTSLPATTGDYTSWTKYDYHDVNGQLVRVDRYHDITGTSGEGTANQLYGTRFLYDTMGRRSATVQYVQEGTYKFQVALNLFDRLGRPTKNYQDVVSSEPASYSALFSSGVPVSSFALLSETEYDSGSVGDSHVTATKSYYAANKYTGQVLHRTYRGHLRGVERKHYDGSTLTDVTPHMAMDVDWMGRTTGAAQYTTEPTWGTVLTSDGYTDFISSTSTGRNAWSKTLYDNLGRVYRTERHPGTQATYHVQVNNYYDRNGRLVATGDKHAAHQELAYDGAGRQYQVRTVKDVSSSTPYSSGAFVYVAPAPKPAIGSMSATGDAGLIEFSHTVYDAGSNPIEEHTFELNSSDGNGIDIDATTSYVRRTMFSWYDAADRLVTMADYGSGEGDASPDAWQYTGILSRPTELDWDDDEVYDGYVLLTKYTYDVAGRQQSTISGVREGTSNTVTTETKTFYDDLGQRTSLAENWVNFAPPTTGIGGGTNNEEDRVTAWEYNGAGAVAKLTAYNGSSGSAQPTKYFYEDPYQGHLLTNTIYPDSSDTDSSGSDQVEVEYALDGLVTKRSGQGGIRTIHEYTYNTRRQLELDAAIQLASDIDTGIESIKRIYDSLGRLEKVTSYDHENGTGTLENELQYEYNAIGALSRVYQSHQGAVNTMSTPYVEFAYAEDQTSNLYTNGLRLDELAYPLVASAKLTHYYNAADTADDRLHRIRYQKLFDGALTASDVHQTMRYSYNGTGRVAHVETYGAGAIDVERKMETATGVYGAWDRFGRTLQQKWNRSTTSHVDVKYGYDYAGNRLWREDVVAAANSQDHDEFYTYDGLQRLKLFDRGNLTGTPPTGITGTPAKEQDWTLDQLGNWSAFDVQIGGATDLDQTRTHNEANELTATTEYVGSAWSNLDLDHAGNMTTMPQPLDLTDDFAATYDAWNRLVKIEDGMITVQTNEYDGLNQRIVRDVTAGDTFDYYYNDKWQVIVEARDGTAEALFAWHAYYIDALAVRFRASDKIAFLHDANFNVTAAYDIDSASGTYRTVIERYGYTPYGEVTVLDANFAADADGVSDIGNVYFYTGRERDPETGLQLNRNRYYHAGLGRWLTRDPLEYDAGLWNLYNYVNSNPNCFVDPSGELGQAVAGCLGGGLIGGIGGGFGGFLTGGWQGAQCGALGGAANGCITGAVCATFPPYCGAAACIGGAIGAGLEQLCNNECDPLDPCSALGIIGGAVAGCIGGQAGSGKDKLIAFITGVDLSVLNNLCFQFRDAFQN